jgi:ABC-type nitrate/sulfonate/bicarbonate transport system substrate-binding protein
MAVVAGSAIFLVACGSGNGSSSDPTVTDTPTTTEEATDETSEPASEAPTFAPVDVTFVTSSRSIANQMVFTVVEGGFLEPYGINAEIVVAESSSVAVAALLSGDAQFMTGSRTEGALAQANGQDVLYLLKHSAGFSSQIAASSDIIESLDGDPMSVPLEDRLRALEGKTVALPSEGSVLTVVFNAAMEDAGVSYEPTYIGGDAMGVALAQGNIDAYFFPPPTPQQTIKEGAGGVLIEGAELPLSGGPTTIQAPLYVTQRYVDSDSDVVVRVTAAFLDAAAWHRDNPDEAKALVRTRLADLDQDVFDLLWEAVEEVFVTPLDSPLSEDDLQFLLDNDLAANEDAAALVAADLMVPEDLIDEARTLAEQVDAP